MDKIFELNDLVRPNIQSLVPYKSARGDHQEGLLLDANENSFGSPFNTEDNLHRYPDPGQKKLREAYAEFRDVLPENVFAGVGSDEVIDILFRVFCEPGRDRIIHTPPTYGMYKVTADIHNVEVQDAPLTDGFKLDAELLLEKAGANTKMIFLCSPNNPTGNHLDKETMLKAIDKFDGIVVVDEAYVDFGERESLAAEAIRHPNLVVMQSFSKSFGLAGIRLGMAIATSPIIDYMMRIKAPYNINKLTARYALEAFDNLETIRFNIEKIREEKERLAGELEKLSAVKEIYPSDANFLLFRIKNALNVFQELTEQGIIIRYRGNEPGCGDCLRATVGTPDENDQLIATLKQITS